MNFTGQNQDTVSGLYDFLLREYNSNQGRWPWPDPSGMGAVSIANPQSWNRYAYVANNPLAVVDPLGLWGKCSGTDCPQRWGINDNLEAVDGILSQQECQVQGLASSCDLVNGELGTGQAAICPDNDCNSIRQNRDTDQWEQIKNWQSRPDRDPDGEPQDTQAGVWGGIPDPTLANNQVGVFQRFQDKPVGNNIWNCPDGNGHDPCANTWKQADCTINGPATDAIKGLGHGVAADSVKGALTAGSVGTSVANGVVASVKEGILTFAFAIFSYGKMMA